MKKTIKISCIAGLVLALRFSTREIYRQSFSGVSMLSDRRFKEKRGSHLLVNIRENHKTLSKFMSQTMLTPGQPNRAFSLEIDGKDFVPYWLSFDQGLPEPSKSKFEIEQAEDAETLLKAYSIWYESFPLINKNSINFLEMMQGHCSHEKSTFQVFTASLDGQVLAASILFLASHTAVVYCLAKKPGFMDQEIKKDLITFNMQRAKELFYPGLGLITNSETMNPDLLVNDLGFTSICLPKSA